MDSFVLPRYLIRKQPRTPPSDIRVCAGMDVCDPKCRHRLVQVSREQCGPQLEVELTAYSPQEGLELLDHPDVQKFWTSVLKLKVPKDAVGGCLIFLPCSRRKPYHRSVQHRELRQAFQKEGFVFTECGVLRKEGEGRFFPVVISEPMGAVPYDVVLRREYPVCHYDCPTFFDYSSSRGWQVTPYRLDNTARDPNANGFLLGENEKKALNEGLKRIARQVSRWLERNLSSFDQVVGLVKTKAHMRVLELTERELGINVPKLFEGKYKKRLKKKLADEKYLCGSTSYNQITGKQSIRELTFDDLKKIANRLKRNRPAWERRDRFVQEHIGDPRALEKLKREIARGSAEMLYAQKPFHSTAFIQVLKEILAKELSRNPKGVGGLP